MRRVQSSILSTSTVSGLQEVQPAPLAQARRRRSLLIFTPCSPDSEVGPGALGASKYVQRHQATSLIMGSGVARPKDVVSPFVSDTCDNVKQREQQQQTAPEHLTQAYVQELSASPKRQVDKATPCFSESAKEPAKHEAGNAPGLPFSTPFAQLASSFSASVPLPAGAVGGNEPTTARPGRQRSMTTLTTASKPLCSSGSSNGNSGSVASSAKRAHEQSTPGDEMPAHGNKVTSPRCRLRRVRRVIRDLDRLDEL